jgi:hypothetical protein
VDILYFNNHDFINLLIKQNALECFRVVQEALQELTIADYRFKVSAASQAKLLKPASFSSKETQIQGIICLFKK